MSCCFYWWTTLLVPGSLLILGPCITCWSPLRDGLCMSHDTDLSHYWSYLVVCCWCCLVAKLCLTLMTLWTASYSVHGISQSRLLEWFAISFSRASSQLQGSNLCLLHWQVDSSPLSHQGSQSYSLGAAYSLLYFLWMVLTCDWPLTSPELTLLHIAWTPLRLLTSLFLGSTTLSFFSFAKIFSKNFYNCVA